MTKANPVAAVPVVDGPPERGETGEVARAGSRNGRLGTWRGDVITITCVDHRWDLRIELPRAAVRAATPVGGQRDLHLETTSGQMLTFRVADEALVEPAASQLVVRPASSPVDAPPVISVGPVPDRPTRRQVIIEAAPYAVIGAWGFPVLPEVKGLLASCCAALLVAWCAHRGAPPSASPGVVLFVGFAIDAATTHSPWSVGGALASGALVARAIRRRSRLGLS